MLNNYVMVTHNTMKMLVRSRIQSKEEQNERQTSPLGFQQSPQNELQSTKQVKKRSLL